MILNESEKKDKNDKLEEVHGFVTEIYEYLNEKGLIKLEEISDFLRKINVKGGIDKTTFSGQINPYTKNRYTPDAYLYSFTNEEIRRSFVKAESILEAIKIFENTKFLFLNGKREVYLRTILPEITSGKAKDGNFKMIFNDDFHLEILYREQLYHGVLTKRDNFFTINFDLGKYKFEIRGMDVACPILTVGIFYYSNNKIANHIGFLHHEEELDGFINLSLLNYLHNTNTTVPINIYNQRGIFNRVMFYSMRDEFFTRVKRIPLLFGDFVKVLILSGYLIIGLPLWLIIKIVSFIFPNKES